MKGSKHGSMAQWARETQQPRLPLSASITNKERAKKRKDKRRERLPLHPQSPAATRQLPGIFVKNTEKKNSVA